MKTLGTVRISGWDSQGSECRRIVANTSTMLFGYKRLSRKHVRAALRRGRGQFICGAWKYKWRLAPKGSADKITVVAKRSWSFLPPTFSTLSLSPALTAKIRKWAKKP